MILHIFVHDTTYWILNITQNICNSTVISQNPLIKYAILFQVVRISISLQLTHYIEFNRVNLIQ